MSSLSADVLSNLDAATAREWLVTNGLGGYACGTVSGVATRRYHGLLVAALSPPRGLHVMITHLDESVGIRGRSTALSAHGFRGGVTPDGWRSVDAFSVDPLPRWRLQAGEVALERCVSMVRGRNTTLVRYTALTAPGAFTLTVRPFGACRAFHELTHANPVADLRVRETPGRVVLRPYAGLPAVTITAPGIFRPGASWWHDFVYAAETARGLDDHEDLWTPGEFIVAMAPGETVYVMLSTEETLPSDAARCETDERARLESLGHGSTGAVHATVEATLLHAVDAYRADCAVPPALLAGYPWFEDWGRDTMISFVGAYLVTQQWDAGRDMLCAFAQYIDQGMLPNRFPDGGGADYNTVDAPLWFFHAARRYVQYTNDRATARDVLYPALASIVAGFRAGTRYDIRVGDDGLVTAGTPDTQLTWMDARVEGRPVTSRHGRPVEINALWHAALRTLAWVAGIAGDTAAATGYHREALRVQEAFRARFWNPARGYLFDVVRDDDSDAAVRPNALVAVALPGELLTVDQAASVLAVAREKLLVPMGLRTLAPGDPGYVGRYAGDPSSRDRAYHQGTAWPYLLGNYTSALVREARRSGDAVRLEQARTEVGALLKGLPEALTLGCVGHLPEVMDGDPPHRGGGCFAQAWSDCEMLRAWVEDAQGRGPEDDG